MGLLQLAGFSSSPTFRDRVAFRQGQRERVKTQISTDFLTFLINNGTRLLAAFSFVGGVAFPGTVIYTVPQGKDFYLIEASLQYKTTALNAGVLSSQLVLTGTIPLTGTSIIRFSPKFADDSVESLSISLSIPVKMVAGETVSLFGTNSNILNSGSIIGYEVDEKLFESAV